MSLQICAILFLLIGYTLAINQSIRAWIYTLLGSVFYVIFFFKSDLYFESFLYAIFVIQSMYGLYKWEKFKRILKLERLDYLKKATYFIISVFLIFLLSIFMLIFTKYDHIILYSSAIILAIYSNYLLALKKIDTWYMLIIINSVMLIISLLDEVFLMSMIYFIFLLLSIRGLSVWKRDL